MTQKDLIEEYLEEFGSILPAKMAGKIYCGMMFGSETSKRCREMRADKMLRSEGEGKFERFYLNTAQESTHTALKSTQPDHTLADCPSYQAFKVMCPDCRAKELAFLTKEEMKTLW